MQKSQRAFSKSAETLFTLDTKNSLSGFAREDYSLKELPGSVCRTQPACWQFQRKETVSEVSESASFWP